ncbi:MAG: hypothetical protein ABEJ58_05305 [Halodesulfurarchaeum sp.]
MRRRTFLRTAGSTTVAGLAGCVGSIESRNVLAPPLVENRPNAVYYPTHYEGMNVSGIRHSGSYSCALTYTYPHRFWLMKPTGVTKVAIDPDDSVHLMPVVWDEETGVIPPDVAPHISISRNGKAVERFSPWPMLSQPMGVHFGDNAHLPGDGTYRVEVSIGRPTSRRTGSLRENEEDVSFSFDFAFSESKLEDIPYTDIPTEKQGTKGAVELMDMENLPSSRVPNPEALPGDVRGTARSGNAKFVVAVFEDASRVGGAEDMHYIAVSPRTPYNRVFLPMMSLSGTLTRDGGTVFDGYLRATIDPELGYHYGASVPSVEAGDSFTITVDSPPQVARHEGYETAFVSMPTMDVTL